MQRRFLLAGGITVMGVITVAAVSMRLSGDDDSRDLPNTSTPHQPSAAATPTPFVDSRPELAADPRPVLQLIVKTMQPVANATVVSVDEMTYGEAMCGLTSYVVPHPEVSVWVIAIDGVWQPFPSRASPPARYRAVKASVIDAATGVSLQTFSPWPLPRDPKANCGR